MGGLAARAVAGDTAARDTLLAHVRVVVHRYCRARLGRLPGSEHAADDVAQEVCLAVLTALPRYRDEGRPFEAFVFGIAAHKVADAQRSAVRAAVPTDDLPGDRRRRARPGGPRGPQQRGRDGPPAARPAAAAPARAAAAARGGRAVRRGDRGRAGHVLRCRAGRPAPRPGPAAGARCRGGGVMISQGGSGRGVTSSRSPGRRRAARPAGRSGRGPGRRRRQRDAGRVRRPRSTTGSRRCSTTSSPPAGPAEPATGVWSRCLTCWPDGAVDTACGPPRSQWCSGPPCPSVGSPLP